MVRRMTTVLVTTLVAVLAIALTPLWAQQQLSTNLATLAKQLKHSAWRTQFHRNGNWYKATVYFKGDKGWFVLGNGSKGKLTNLQTDLGDGGLFRIWGKWNVGDDYGYFKFERKTTSQVNSFAGQWGKQPNQWLGEWNGKLLYFYDPWQWSANRRRHSCMFHYKNNSGTWTWNMVFWYPSGTPQYGWYFFANREQHFWGRCAGPGNPIYDPTVEKWAKMSGGHWERQPDGDCLSPVDADQSIPEGIPDNFPDPPA